MSPKLIFVFLKNFYSLVKMRALEPLIGMKAVFLSESSHDVSHEVLLRHIYLNSCDYSKAFPL
jgi:hypothetical protein